MRNSGLYFILFALFLCASLHSQENNIHPTPASQRLDSYQLRKEMQAMSPLKNLKMKNIGPTVFSGRVADIEVNPDNPSEFYVAYASGGLWYTNNNGTSFKPIFDKEAVMTIGDIAIDWNTGKIWVGTGEVNSSRSSYAGVGIYTSIDTGVTWQHKGLAESHHIGRVILNPGHPEEALVAALGHLYTGNPERGIYKTLDGGNNWKLVLFVSDSAGAVDLIHDPQFPTILYAATWERSRVAWNFKEAGEGSGIYRSVDGGDNWEKINTKDSGFPSGEFTGRIGIDIAPDGRIYALLDNNAPKPEEEDVEDDLKKEKLRAMSKQEFLALDSMLLADFLDEENFPKPYNVDTLKSLVRNDSIEPHHLADYLGDANKDLFSKPVIGAEVYVSHDRGKSWGKTHEKALDRVYYSYGYYFGQIRVSPQDPDLIYILGVPILLSEDGGVTWKSVNEENVHVDHHALWINPENKRHIILGNDGGINISYDGGEHWIKCNSPAVGQFYTVAVDNAEPYNVFGGLQDNGVWMGPNTYRGGTRWHSSGRYPYQTILGGDGMQIGIDTRDNKTVYTGYQFGNYFRINLSDGRQKKIQPAHELGEIPYRWNWQSPIHLSVHNQDILYMGSEYLHRSMDKGEHFIVLSPDLTKGPRKGDVPFGTLTTIDESPLRFGLLYTGSDDSRVHVSRDGGYSWQLISGGLPAGLWVSRVEASQHTEGRVYCTLNGYRNDHFNAYAFRSDNYGKNWHRIGERLPSEPINVILEDPFDESILYIGTDHSLYISFDGGKSFKTSGVELPDVPVHDLAIQKREKEIILGTHGRSFYKADISFLPKFGKYLHHDTVYFLTTTDIEINHSESWGDRNTIWQEYAEKTIELPYFSASDSVIKFKVYYDDIVCREETLTPDRGLNYVEYDMSFDSSRVRAYQEKLGEKKEDPPLIEPSENGTYYLIPGKYTLTLENGSVRSEIKITLKSDD